MNKATLTDEAINVAGGFAIEFVGPAHRAIADAARDKAIAATLQAMREELLLSRSQETVFLLDKGNIKGLLERAEARLEGN